jgi:hypothetical protein
MGLRESMRRFDASRGKPVAKPDTTEHPLVGHEEREADDNDLLH